MQVGRLYQAAPELRVRTWIDGSGEPMDTPLRLDDLGSGYKIIFAFQHWCPGCHSSGFPTPCNASTARARTVVGSAFPQSQ
jgi:hypothetical protein